MSHPVPWMDYSEETMTPEDIKKLPTPLCDDVEWSDGTIEPWIARSLEQQRDVLMMDLEEAHALILGLADQQSISDDWWRGCYEKQRETVASIRQMKGGK